MSKHVIAEPCNLYEVSWEIANKVGGIYTVVSSKARTAVERLGDNYVLFGPWLRGERLVEQAFEDVPGYDDFIAACEKDGIPVRVGRWLVPGRPLTVLVAFSGLYDQKDGVLAGLWERHRVDSLTGQWDYIEPVLFGQAAAIAMCRWSALRQRGPGCTTVAQFHEWLAGAGLLYLHDWEPSIGTVFTTHATVLGRAAASRGLELEAALRERTAEALAEELGVRAKHSLEAAVVRAADVFTTVSGITAEEAALIHSRPADELLPNGIDLELIDEQASAVSRSEAVRRLRHVAACMLGCDVDQAGMVALSGRYEFRNKGVDLFLEALGELNGRAGSPLVAWILCPTGNSGLLSGLTERLGSSGQCSAGWLGLATHNLFDPARDPVHVQATALGLAGRSDQRVKLIQVPTYLMPGDGFLDLPYEAVIGAMDLTCFPSLYEPWGYTPLESLAVGVPTVTSDQSGFGQWCLQHGLGPEDGVWVLARRGQTDEAAANDLAGVIERLLAQPPDADRIAARCRAVAQRLSWSSQFDHYSRAHARAAEVQASRLGSRAPSAFPVLATVPLQPTTQSNRPNLQPFEVRIRLPAELVALGELAENYWWTWDAAAQSLFEALSPDLWRAVGHNPTRLLQQVGSDELCRAAEDSAFRTRLAAVAQRFRAYMAAPASLPGIEESVVQSNPPPKIAYFCAEYGLHESLPIYSGGLGVLAGDHLKSASDRALPLVAVGLLYQRGYVEQRMTGSGEQVSGDALLRPSEHALKPVLGADGQPVLVQLATPDGALTVRAWRADVGRVALFLLDTLLPENRAEDRETLGHLYGGGPETRLRQEIILGRAGVRLLQQLGIRPAVYHLNEGHAALVVLERVSQLVRQEGLTFEEARELVRASTVFTTHTPLPAGHDRFGEDLLRRHFSDVPLWLGIPWERFFALGQCPAEPGLFNMTGLALHFAGFVNGVSQRHQRVSQELLQAFWPSLLVNEVPVQAITNGVHLASWTGPEIRALLGDEPRPLNGESFARSSSLDEGDLWRARSMARDRMIEEVGRRLRDRSLARHDPPRLINRILEGLIPEALYVGFARRFAPYKRANLIFRDLDRLQALLEGPERPVRIILAGLAHPDDELGKALLRQVFEFSRSERFAGRIFFVDGHDIGLERLLVQGCDVWLNTPVHGLEACGTSGMKAAANGGLNLSTLDGWWLEAFGGENGWAMGGDRVYEQQELQDELDAAALYRLLGDVIVPLFFERDGDGLPRKWLSRVGQSLSSIPTRFNSDRMVGEYAAKAYLPAARRQRDLVADRYASLRTAVGQLATVRAACSSIRVRHAQIEQTDGEMNAQRLVATAEVILGSLQPDDVIVEMVLGQVAGERALENMAAVTLQPTAGPDDEAWSFQGTYVMRAAGRFAYGIRVRPRHLDLADPLTGDLVIWA